MDLDRVRHAGQRGARHGSVQHAEPGQAHDVSRGRTAVQSGALRGRADVYSEAPHAGRGGWTWYTGSAGWLYRAGLEWILGFRVRENRVTLVPCVPAEWPGFTIQYRHRGAHHVTPYEFIVDKQTDPRAQPLLVIDGVVQNAGTQHGGSRRRRRRAHGSHDVACRYSTRGFRCHTE
jgi:hypothetical protein